MTANVSIAGKVVAVTGGANGIGREIAKQFAAAGAHVAIGDYDGAAARATANDIDGILSGFDLDVSDAASFTNFLAAVEAKWGPVDVLVNNAGVMWVGPFDAEPQAATERQLSVNLLGAIHGIKLATPAMVSRGAGHIITIASAASLLPTPGEATYSASKHGIFGYLKAVRAELHRSPVNLSIVMPTVVETALSVGTATGAAKILQPADVAAAVLRIVERPRFQVTLPGYVGPLQAVISVLPMWMRDPIFRSMVPDQVRSVDRAARTGYDGQFGGQK